MISMRTTSLILVLIFWTNFITCQNLIQNGSFELGGPGNGFIIDGAGYVMLIPPFSGTTVSGNYAFTTDPILVNTGFLSGGDHTTGTGMMMIIDGNTVGGQQRLYKAGSNGGGICGLTVGLTYTFSYWIKSISANSNTVATLADIGVQFNNVSSFQIVSGSTLAPHPDLSWQEVVYQFTPNNNCVNIELFNNNTSGVGNNFAIDDLSVNGPPDSLQFTYSLVSAGCGSPTNFIAFYPKGGTPPYNFSISGAASLNNTTGFFDNLPPGPYSLTINDASGASESVSNVVLNTSPASGVITQDTAICQGQSVYIHTASPVNLGDWVTTPNDPSLQSLNSTTFTATPSQTTTYSLGGSGNANLIYNHSFQLGATGFFTHYQLLPSNPSANQGVAGVTSNPQLWFNLFNNCADQDGTNSMLVVDASTLANTVVWRQTVPVQTSTIYNFSYWATSVVSLSPAQLQVRINGVSVNTTALTSTTCNWQNIAAVWNSGASNLATIEIVNMNLTGNGNDFAIDNISFSKDADCQITVTVAPFTPINIQPSFSVCQGGNITLSVPNMSNLEWQTPAGNTVNSGILTITNATNADAGVYTVSVSGGGLGSCHLPGQTTLVVNSGPVVTTSVQNVSCFGEQNGIATANVTGNEPFIFNWSNGATNQTINNLAPQNYMVQVTDANGCVSTSTATVGEPDNIVLNIQTTDTDCNFSNGTATANINGGTAPYNVVWSNGGTGSIANNLEQGNYTVSVTDANGCSQSANFSIQFTNGFNVSVASIQSVSCQGATDGSVELLVTGGDQPYIFVWNPNVNSTEVATNLIAGNYSVQVIDAGGCVSAISFTIEEPPALTFSTTTTNPTCGLLNGSITVNVSGGVEPYSYNWTNGVSINNAASNLSAGNYNIQIVDANGCEISTSQNLQTVGNIPIQISATSLVIQAGSSANLGVFVGGGITDFNVSWTPAEGLNCASCQFTQASPGENTIYSVTVTTPDGCASTESIQVIVEIPCGNVYLPTIFSPNKDGLNDAYCVLGSCSEFFELTIYNRWGEEVFRSNSPSICWDGKFRGKDVPTGVYAYKFASTESNGKVNILSGNITLVR
jgi:gliding motility-associated-like protein